MPHDTWPGRTSGRAADDARRPCSSCLRLARPFALVHAALMRP